MDFLQEIPRNQPLSAALISWFIAQLLKVVLTFFKTKDVDLGRFIGSGGMPSAHSAFTVSLAVSIGKLHSYDSPTFALACAFALVVMYDAAGVRRAVGNQASIINRLIKDVTKGEEAQEKLKELVGHTPFEVVAGALLGLIISILYIG